MCYNTSRIFQKFAEVLLKISTLRPGFRQKPPVSERTGVLHMVDWIMAETLWFNTKSAWCKQSCRGTTRPSPLDSVLRFPYQFTGSPHQSSFRFLTQLIFFRSALTFQLFSSPVGSSLVFVLWRYQMVHAVWLIHIMFAKSQTQSGCWDEQTQGHNVKR